MTMTKRRIPLATLDISLINNNEKDQDSSTTSKLASPMGTTYRAEGLSIGRDYMRFEGITLSSSLSPRDILIEDTVGKGACSIVKRARHVITNQPFALKIFPMGDEKRREILVKELRAMCTLNYNCECLIGLIGAFFDQEDETIAMVLEYMDRGSLKDFLSSHDALPSSVLNQNKAMEQKNSDTFHALPEPIIAAIAYQILWGLGYLHHEKISHRDIKPANVLINSAGQVKLSDFGIASRRMDGEQQMNHTVVGTTRYMSPERLHAKPYTSLSDIWSFGLLLLECATGEPPFQDSFSIVELVQTIEEYSIEDIVPKTLNKEFREVLISCLQKNPDDRIPASILISSPWFSTHGIQDVSDASCIMRTHIEQTMPKQKPNLLSLATIESMIESERGLGIYQNYV